MVVTNPKNFQKDLLTLYHDIVTSGHPGIDHTYQALSRDYWWPTVRRFTEAFIKGCAVCQQNNAIMHKSMLPLDPIWPDQNPEPFKMISIDLITKLPVLNRFNSVLTVTDQGCTKATLVIFCKKGMGLREFTKLYLVWVFPFIRLPSKLISD